MIVGSVSQYNYMGDFDILVSQVCQLNILIFHEQG